MEYKAGDRVIYLGGYYTTGGRYDMSYISLGTVVSDHYSHFGETICVQWDGYKYDPFDDYHGIPSANIAPSKDHYITKYLSL